MKILIPLGFLAGLTMWGTTLEVTVSNASEVSHETVAAAMARLHDILGIGAIQLTWGEEPPTSGFLIEAAAAQDGAAGVQQRCRASRIIHARIVAAPPPGHLRSALGYSIPLSSQGINVTIFQSAIRATADRSGIEIEVVLAHALAHEIGHVLQRSLDHAPHGLMSAAWASGELEMMRRTGLRFSTEQVQAMKKTLDGAGCARMSESETLQLPPVLQ